VSAAANQQRVEAVFAELAKGNGAPFRELLADDVCWIMIGTTRWSGTYRGKRAVVDELLRPLFERFADRYTSTLRRVIADDDHVVIECTGRVTTRDGRPYDNTYCYVCRMADGRIRELTEYMDTALVAAVL